MKIFKISLVFIFAGAQTGFAQIQVGQPIGVAGAVAGRVNALHPKTKIDRPMSSGKEVVMRDKVTTKQRGRLQVLLLDETAFTIGPNSEITIDEFDYDPFTQTGKVVANVTKGVFRLVTGKIARKKPSAMKVTLPTGTIGIRGTIAAGAIRSDDSVLVALLGPGSGNNAGERPGSIEVTNAGQSVTLTRPGFASIIRPGQAPTPPFNLSTQQLASLDTKPAAEAGAGDPEGTEKVAKKTGELGKAKTVAQATGIKQAQSAETTESTTDGAQSAANASGAFSFADLRGALASGTGLFSGVGTVTCTGTGNCSAAQTANLDLHFSVNWGTQIFGGGSGDHLAFEGGVEICAIGGVTCGPGGNVEATLPGQSFASLSGDAVFTMGSNLTTGGTNGSQFDGTTLTFTDAGTVETVLSFNPLIAPLSGESLSGEVTATCGSGACP
ncbi:MAG: hypothetical protein COB53_01280 [Elusimicrobia bacterium]|nr:MAG: hypothetical protein COB53_01280 [Elusimicrobiota bacterium]